MMTAVAPFVLIRNLVVPATAGKVIFLRGVAFVVFLLVTILLFLRDSSSSNKKSSKDIFFERLKEIIKDPIFITLSVSIILLVVSTFFAFDKTVAFFGEPQRNEGFITLFCIFILYFCFRFLFDKKEWNLFFLLSSITSVVLFIIEVIQVMKGAIRPEALSGNPDFLAMQYLFFIFAGFYIFILGKKLQKNWYLFLGSLAVFVSIVGIFLAKTRSVLLGLVVAIIFSSIFALVFGKDKFIFNKFSLRKAGVIACSLIITFSMLFFLTKDAIFWTKVPGVDRVILATKDNSSVGSRVIYIKTAMTIFTSEKQLSRVLFGWGWDNYVFAWGKHYDPKIFYFDAAVADRAHNKIADVLIMSGILGLIAYLTLWFFVFKKILTCFRNGESMLAFSFFFFSVAYFISLLFSFDVALTLFYFYIIIALLSFLENERKI